MIPKHGTNLTSISNFSSPLTKCKLYHMKIFRVSFLISNKWRAKFINSVAFKFDLDRSVELTVKSLEGKNYNLVIKNLADTIYPTKSHWKVKNGGVYSNLFLILTKIW